MSSGLLRLFLEACLVTTVALALTLDYPKINAEGKISTNVSDIEFLLFTSENPKEEQILIFDDLDSITQSNFNGLRPTKVLVHGWGDNGRTDWVIWTKDKFLETGDYNVISVNWELLAGPGPDYFAAAENVKPTGLYTGSFLQFIIDHTEASYENVHPIGFSLGGQVVGLIGYQLNGRLSRITGLDPAGPLFHTVNDSERLSPDDAVFVDVIHSAGLWIGTDELVGHVDFYPNSGMAPQPGCENETIGLSCSHNRAPYLFAESIFSEVGFEAVQCSTWEDFDAGLCDNATVRNMMGMPADRGVPGVFYLRTNAEPPYAIP